MNAVPMSVLIVDDHARFRARARRLLESEGFTVVGEAHDGASGLAAARDLAPDVVLLDVHLPDADGFDLAASFADAGEGDGPIVILTSSLDASDVVSLLPESGARGFVPKDQLSGPALAAVLA
jgi:DNA-binding NarL/FixJ family response regulator